MPESHGVKLNRCKYGKCDVKTELPGGGDVRVSVTGAAGDWMDKKQGCDRYPPERTVV